MLFNSIDFLIFLPFVLVTYWFISSKRLTLQNAFLLIASYVFYAWWDWRFLFLLLLSTFIDYYFGLIIYRSVSKKKLFLVLSIINNLSILCFFKYYNFFADSTKDFLQLFGMQVQPYLLKIVLPVGISFYTFHGMSYVFDIYRGKTVPVKNFVQYALFVCFFPLLVAGPIERATHLLPQVQNKRRFDKVQFKEGLKMMIWGFFKKMVIADSIAPVVNNVFKNYEHYSGATLAYGAFLFAIQIYCDFSGYTDIALGTAKLYGFELLTNFRFPYFSRDIAEFWRRWHISLSSWFRDYLYIPLGGSKEGKLKAIRNTLIIFLVSGFWHGANWTFLAWGGIHAILFIPLLITGSQKKNMNELGGLRFLPSLKEVLQVIITFILVTIAWIFFRSPHIIVAFSYIAKIFTDLASPLKEDLLFNFDLVSIMILFVFDYLLMKHVKLPKLLSVSVYLFFLIAIAGCFYQKQFSTQFIYFQF